MVANRQPANLALWAGLSNKADGLIAGKRLTKKEPQLNIDCRVGLWFVGY